jgi:hypothetical protein
VDVQMRGMMINERREGNDNDLWCFALKIWIVSFTHKVSLTWPDIVIRTGEGWDEYLQNELPLKFEFNERIVQIKATPEAG